MSGSNTLKLTSQYKHISGTKSELKFGHLSGKNQQ